MDTEKVGQIQDALAQLKELEDRAAEASAAERRSLNAVARTINRQVGTLQKGVLNEYDPDFVTCRDLGHSWRLRRTDIEDGILYRTLRCSRCPTERYEQLNRFGDLLKRAYKHAEGYLLPSALTGHRYTKQFWRGLQFVVAVDKAKHENE